MNAYPSWKYIIVVTVLVASFVYSLPNFYNSYPAIEIKSNVDVLNENNISNVCGGFILTCVGGPSDFSYKSTFLGDHIIDQTIENTLSTLTIPFKKLPFSPRGSDERQFSSPGFRIPIGVLCKDKFHEYDYYHT